MGCCRGRKRNPVASRGPCSILDQAGSNLLLWPMFTDKGPQITVKTDSAGFVELGSFVGSYRCSSATATLIKRYLPLITQLAQLHPRLLAPYTRTGISLLSLVKMTDRIRRPTGNANSP